MNDSRSSVNFLSALAAFSASLSQSDLAIFRVHYNIEVFGSWTIEMGRRHRRALVEWDGREFVMSISLCDVSDSRAAKGWKVVSDEQLDSGVPYEELFQIAENLVLEKF